MKKRYLKDVIRQDLSAKMVFIGGPRQVGKTTLTKQVARDNFSHFAYFNWDYQPDRKEIITMRFPAESDLLIFDEIHKYKDWKNYLKGLYDKYQSNYKIMVSGSAKLNVYRRGGDSLMGRYFYYVLHPYSLGELKKSNPVLVPFKKLSFPAEGDNNQQILRDLLKFGGFPEPFSKKNIVFWRRWQRGRLDVLVKEEIRSLERINELSGLQVLVELLPDKVGSLLSINNLAQDLQVTYKTAKAWLNVLEKFYYFFRIYPFASKKIRSLRKMAKAYLWDWSVLDNQGAKFENLIAAHLLKLTDFLRNNQGYNIELFYLRDKQGREVDFLIAVDKKPWFAVEAKLKLEEKNNSLKYFRRKLSIPYSYQVVLTPGIDFVQDNIRTISAAKFLGGLV